MKLFSLHKCTKNDIENKEDMKLLGCGFWPGLEK